MVKFARNKLIYHKMRKRNSLCKLLLISGAVLFTACDGDFNDRFVNKINGGNPLTDIPSDNLAGETPVITEEEITFNMPTSISPIQADPENKNIGRFSMPVSTPMASGWSSLEHKRQTRMSGSKSTASQKASRFTTEKEISFQKQKPMLYF